MSQQNSCVLLGFRLGQSCRVQPLQALGWEAAPVVTDFDVRFNSKRLLWFEKLFQPFLSGTYKTEEEPLYDK